MRVRMPRVCYFADVYLSSVNQALGYMVIVMYLATAERFGKKEII